MSAETRDLSDSSNERKSLISKSSQMNQKKQTIRDIHIYKHEFQTPQLLPAKSHNPYQSSQGTPKVMSIRNDSAKPLFD